MQTNSSKSDITNKVVYNDGKYKLTHLGTKEDVLKSIAKNGEHLTYTCTDDFSDNLCLIWVKGKGYGYIDKDLNLVIPPKYKHAVSFCDGKALAFDGEKYCIIDTKGKELPLSDKYKDVRSFSDGLARVSTLVLNQNLLAYHYDWADEAGIWGYIDEFGNEVIKPQYIFAGDFIEDRAIVAKGKWENKTWKEGCVGYHSEKELWGVIDKNGNEIIPCIYDEIQRFSDGRWNIIPDYFQIHVGGWKDGKWAVIDKNGNFITEPVFCEFTYECKNGVITFYDNPSADDGKIGIYDLKTNKILFDCQFETVFLLDDGNFCVCVYDEKLGHDVDKIIDATGKEIVSNGYTYIDTSSETEYKFRTDDGFRGRVDKTGKELERVFCPDATWDGVDYVNKVYIYEQDEKQGVKDFQNNIIIPPEYYQISRFKNDVYETIKTKDYPSCGLRTLDGKIILDDKYEYIILDSGTDKIMCSVARHTDIYNLEIMK